MKYRTLVVDDEQTALDAVCLILNQFFSQFHIIGTAKNGLEALSFIEVENPDLVFTDIRMPQMSGLELIKHIHINNPDIFTIIISGHQDFDYVHSALVNGSIDYVLKPVSPEQMGVTIARALPHLDRMVHNKKQCIPPPASAIHNQKMYNQICLYIEQNIAQPLTLEGICRVFGISQPTLSRVFREHSQMSFNQYLTHRRIEIAKQLLKNKEHMVRDIAAKVGYSDQFYFSRVFRSVVGIAPSEY